MLALVFGLNLKVTFTKSMPCRRVVFNSFHLSTKVAPGEAMQEQD